MSPRTFLLAAGLLALPLPGQPLPNPAPASPRTAGTAAARPDSLAQISTGSQAAAPARDSLAAPKSRADTVLVVKHRFDHREQIITGSVVMTCLALMMVIMNNYNPR